MQVFGRFIWLSRPRVVSIKSAQQIGVIMKKRKQYWLGLFLASSLGGVACLAEAAAGAGGNKETAQERVGQVLDSEPREGPERPSVSERPELPVGEGISLTIRERLQEFHQKREEYLQQQRELARQLRGASQDDLEAIRARIREQRQAWLEEANRIREQARERVQQLREELPRHQEMIDAARERARERVEEARERALERRGLD